MGNFLSKNLRLLRDRAGLTQDDFASIGIKKATYSNYETGKTEPKLDTLVDLSNFLKVPLHELISVDLEHEPTPTSNEIQQVLPPHIIPDEVNQIPIVDVEAAAGAGSFNPDHIEVLGYLSLPTSSLSHRRGTYYAIRTRGESMSPTIFDKDYLIIRQLSHAEFSELRDEYVYVVVTREGQAFVKRIKDRLKTKGFIVCMSDNLNKAAYPNFVLEEAELSELFFVEFRISARMPNINATYFDRLRDLEDRVEEIEVLTKRLR